MNITKSGGAITIAPSRSENSSQSFSIPNNWPLPKFAIGDRVEYCAYNCVMTCTVRGVEFYPVADDAPDYMRDTSPTGWIYSLWPDHNPTIKTWILEDAFLQPVDEEELEAI